MFASIIIIQEVSYYFLDTTIMIIYVLHIMRDDSILGA